MERGAWSLVSYTYLLCVTVVGVRVVREWMPAGGKVEPLGFAAEGFEESASGIELSPFFLGINQQVYRHRKFLYTPWRRTVEDVPVGRGDNQDAIQITSHRPISPDVRSEAADGKQFRMLPGQSKRPGFGSGEDFSRAWPGKNGRIAGSHRHTESLLYFAKDRNVQMARLP